MRFIFKQNQWKEVYFPPQVFSRRVLAHCMAQAQELGKCYLKIKCAEARGCWKTRKGWNCEKIPILDFA